jgi:Zn-dependent protease with chaperone function
MKYTPRRITENVNVSKTSPLREFFTLLLGILAFLVGVYVLLGLTVDLVAPRISPRLEDRLAGLFTSFYAAEDPASPERDRLQDLLDDLSAAAGQEDRSYQVHVVPDPLVNAVALPGGHIVLFSGLLDQVTSENELAMILGHELGHFGNRDHLKGLGRGLVLVFLSAAVLGVDSKASRMLQSLLVTTEMRFSRKQELLADAWGLELLVRKYGHAGGATDFFRRVHEKEKGKRFAYLFATHPYPKKRVRSIEMFISEREIPVGETVPFSRQASR